MFDFCEGDCVTELAWILDTKYAGIIRPKNQEPYEGELILLASRYGSQQNLDLRNIASIQSLSVPDLIRAAEPGEFKYYLVILPFRASLRPKGSVPISAYWLDTGTKFDLVQDAEQEFQKYV